MLKYKIISNSPVTCYGYGLWFNGGVAETNSDELAEYLKKKGYTVQRNQTKKLKE